MQLQKVCLDTRSISNSNVKNGKNKSSCNLDRHGIAWKCISKWTLRFWMKWTTITVKKNSKVFEQKGDLLNFKENIDPMAAIFENSKSP